MTANRSILRRHKVEAITGFSRSSIYRLIAKGEFPSPIALSTSGRAVGWLASEIEAWLDAQISNSRKAA